MADSATIISDVKTGSNITSNLSGGAEVSSNIVSSTIHTSDVAPSGPPGMIQSIVAGTNIEVDASDPNNPIVSADVDVADLPTGIPATNLADGSISDTEFQYLNNVSSNIQTQLDAKVDENSAITGATKTKVTYDAKGLVTAGADATTTDIGEGSNLYFTNERAQDAIGGILVDSSELDFTYNDDTPSITASLVAGSIDESKLDTSVNASLDLADSAVQDLSDLGITASATEINYTSGVSSAIQTQLDNKQPLDSDLTTIAGLTPTTDNFMVAASSAWASRTPAQAKTSLSLVKGDVGLGNVDNTSDANKPVSTATQTALDLKAPLASPSFTGTVTLPTGLTGVLRADSGVVSTDSDVTDLVSAASDTTAGKVELATTAETTTGTDATRAVTPDGLHDMTSLAGAAWFLDEDDFVSDSATKVPSQQSTKAYITAQVLASGSGDVVGPSSATDNAIARFDLTTGKLIQDSAVTIADTSGNMAGVGTINTLTLPSSNFVGLTDSQTLTNKTIVGANNTISGITPAMRTGGFAVGTFNTTSSPVVVSGLGFRPKRVRFWHKYSSTAYLGLDGVSIDDGGSGIHQAVATGINTSSQVSTVNSVTDSILIRTATGSTTVVGKVTTWGSDGFTVTLSSTENRDIFYEALG